MYGEDLDWCYRVRRAGFTVRYVPATAIIHYKGESTRRSNIDEMRVFYHAMQQFVEKHYQPFRGDGGPPDPGDPSPGLCGLRRPGRPSACSWPPMDCCS